MRKMKDSGIAWIGEIPEEWKAMPIKRIAKILRGGSPRPIEQYMSLDDKGYNWIRIGDSKKGSKYICSTQRKIIPDGLSKTRLIKKGSLILSNSMSFGQPYILEIDGCIHDGWVAFSDLSVEKEFLYYYLVSDFAHTQFEQQVSGGVVLNLNIDKIGTNQILIPNINEQHRIAAFLDEKCAHIDAVIEKTRASIDEYKKLKQAIITRAVTKGLRQGRKMKDSGIEWIGEIPEEWDIVPFRHVLHERTEKNNPVKSKERLSLSIDLGVTLYSEKTTNLDRFKDDFEQYKVAHVGDLVMNSMNMIVGATGVSAYYGCVSPAYYTFYDDLEDHATTKYCEYLFRSKTIMRVLYSLGRGIYAIVRGDDRVNTCRLKVSREDLRKLQLPTPSVSEQREIIAYLDAKTAAIDRLIAKKEQLIAEMQSCKKSLIYEAVTGKREAAI